MKKLFIPFMLLFIACGSKTGDIVETESGLKYVDVKEGKVTSPQSGQRVSVHYSGWLYDENQPDNKGNKFDSSHDRPGNFEFKLGSGQVIKGWDQGVQGMKVGGKRTLIIPSSLGYGKRGAGDAIPPNATLIFDVELIKIH